MSIEQDSKERAVLLGFTDLFPDLFNPFLQVAVCFYLPVDFTDYTAYCTVVVHK